VAIAQHRREDVDNWQFLFRRAPQRAALKLTAGGRGQAGAGPVGMVVQRLTGVAYLARMMSGNRRMSRPGR
jgi:hypothetical protein